jgi:bifunctional non-homologous end joining protein LigD
MPQYSPMLATPWPGPFADDGWVWEVKWDGVRTLLTWDGRRVTLRSRAGNDATDRYPELGGTIEGPPVIIDGEIVALDDAHRPSFERLQQRMNLGSPHLVREAMTAVPVNFVAFDLLHADAPVIGEPIEARRERLAAVQVRQPVVIGDRFEGDPAALWDSVRHRGIEGIVAKRRGSPYRPGVRSADWRKVTVRHRLRAVVGGFTPGIGGRADSFGGLLVGLWQQDRLRWIGSVGTGFDHAALRAIRHALDDMASDASPFHDDPMLPKQRTWVVPRLVAMVEFKEWTAGPRLRAPVFVGFTDDDVDAATWEVEGPG